MQLNLVAAGQEPVTKFPIRRSPKLAGAVNIEKKNAWIAIALELVRDPVGATRIASRTAQNVVIKSVGTVGRGSNFRVDRDEYLRLHRFNDEEVKASRSRMPLSTSFVTGALLSAQTLMVFALLPKRSGAINQGSASGPELCTTPSLPPGTRCR